MRRIIWLLLVLPCAAQVNGNLPKLVQTYQSGTDILLGSCNSAPSTAFDIPLCDQVTNGNLVVVGIDAQESGSTAYTVTDINGVVPTFTCRTPVYDAGTSLNSVICYGLATSSGNVEIQWNGTPGNPFNGAAAEFTNISGTLDVAKADTATGTPSTVANTFTTTINGDLLVTIGTVDVGESVPRSPEFFITYNRENSASKTIMTYTNAGLAGSTTVTHDNGKQSGTPATTMILQTLAFKPSTIKVVTTTMPTASASTAYSAQLQAVGGTGAYTFACTVLPSNGLSLNTGTGVISGTPTAGTISPSCTATDGTLTSAGASVPITISATAFGTPAVAQATATSVANSQTFPQPVCAGDTLGVVMAGYDTHFGNAWMPNPIGNNNHLNDSTGATFTQVCSSAGTYAAPLAFYVGVAQASTFDTVTFTKTYTGSPLSWAIIEFHNVQPTVDCGTIAYNLGNATSPWSFNLNYTTPIPNEMLLFSSEMTGSGGNTLSQSAPFSTFINNTSFGDLLAVGDVVESSTGTYTGTTNLTSTLPDSNQGVSQIVGLRPDVPNSCSVQSFTGEKRHRVVY